MGKIPEDILKRKGAATTAGVPTRVRQLLERGEIETANLCEWLIVDQVALAMHIGQSHGHPDWSARLQSLRAKIAKPTAIKSMKLMGEILAADCCSKKEVDELFYTLQPHRSDLVRSWAGFLIGHWPGLTLTQRLDRLQLLAADTNMAVRETAWLAVREQIIAKLHTALKLLQPWSTHPDANIRRFASEATRPRGVWCRHITALIETPELGLPVLEPLKSDPSKYVRDSVANWLNDASKSQSQWVTKICIQWEKASPTPETRALVKRALRTIRK